MYPIRSVVVDIDGTICEQLERDERCLAKPFQDAINTLHRFRDMGIEVILYTARSWTEYRMTLDWLNRHQVPFDRLLCGKPKADLWIDDRAVTPDDWSDILHRVEESRK